MTIKDLLAKGVSIISIQSNTSQLDVEILLTHVLGKKKSYLYAHQEEIVSSSKEKEFLKLINKRVKRTPIAYLINKKEFYGLDFYVDENVLIPRPETEQLVEMVIKEASRFIDAESGKRKPVRLIDLGTGCGNIGIAVVYEVLKRGLNKKCKFEIYLTDISGKALKVAKRNFKKLIKQLQDIRVYFVKADLFDDMQCCFDIVVSNPPYIPEKDIEYLDPNVRDHEPHVALSGGVGGFEIIKRLIKESIGHLTPEGTLLFEMHERHPNKIKYYLEESFPKWKAKFYKDCFGMWRFGRINKG
jgi:release factor glutamine methyltransferase